MKRVLLMLLLALMVPLATKADVIEIGTAENMYDFPFHTWTYGAWDEEIYPMSAFSGPCVINAISYNNLGVYGMMYPMAQMASSMRIYMGERESLTHASETDWTPLSELTLVYSHENVSLGAECGWEEIVLDDPFVYGLNGNLVVVVATAYDSPAWDVSLTSSSYADGNVSLVYSSQWGPETIEFPTEGGALYSEFADIQFSVTPLNEVISIGNAENMYDFPFHTWTYGAWDEEIYPMSAFSGPCAINAISYNNLGIYGMMYPMAQMASSLRIYMGERESLTHASETDWTPLSELTLVYSHENVSLGAECGWEEIVLDDPFVYGFNGNLVVVVATTYDSPAWDVSLTSSSYADGNVSLVYTSEWGPGAIEFPSEGGALYSEFADIQFSVSYAPVSVCHTPNNIVISEVAATSATITWAANEGADTWDVYISNSETPSAETVPTATGITSTNYTFTGLNGLTNYTAYVRANCGDGNVSRWRSASFLTDPDLIGNGTAESPFLLYTKYDLEQLTTGMAAGFDTYGKHFRVMHDINEVTTPISGDFRGDFDGNNHTITLNMEGAGNLALFAMVGRDASIHDLIVDGFVNSSGGNAAGFVSYARGSWGVSINNCTNRATIICNSSYAGGFVADASMMGGVITNCVNQGNVVATGSYVGGIIGNCNSVDVNHCENRGEVAGESIVGGICGWMSSNASIVNCVNYGGVACSDKGGGIAGQASVIYNCYNRGDLVFGTNSGGICGEQWVDYGYFSIENCFNAGMMTAANTTNCGALVGMIMNSSSAARCYYNYYLEGTYSVAYGSDCIFTCLDHYSSFTQNSDFVSWTLAEPQLGTNDLLTALNNWRDGNESYLEWFADIYGNNNYLPTFHPGTPPGIEISPNPIVMAPRPIGAWMQGEKVLLANTSQEDLQISGIEFDDNYFLLDESAGNIDVPFTLYAGQSQEVYIGTNSDFIVEPGTMTAQMSTIWNQIQVELVDIEVNNYTPVSPDVVELAEVVTSLPQTITQSTDNLYDNYKLPGDHPDAADAVYQLVFAEQTLFNAQVTMGSNAKLALYREDFNGRPGPMVDNYYGVTGLENSGNYATSYGGDDPITNMLVVPGTYYLVVSSTSPQFVVELTTEVFPAPIAALPLTPSVGATDITAPLALQWQFGAFTAEYQLLFGTSNPPTEVLVDWTFDLKEFFIVDNLLNNRTYYWRVNERNAVGITESAVWHFTTPLNAPTELQANTSIIHAGHELLLHWTAPMRSLLGYNVYQDGVQINAALVTDTEYTVSNLAYNMEGCAFTVTAVYDEGESAPSNAVVVRVGGTGTISGTVFEQDGVTGIAGVTVNVIGYDEFNVRHSYAYITDNNGNYWGAICSGRYVVLAEKEGYQDGSHGEEVMVSNDAATEGVDIILYENYNTVGEVVAQYYADPLNPQNSYVKVYWGSESRSTSVGLNRNTDRSFHSYSIYRTNCYNDGPFTEENTILVANGVTDTVYIDMSWTDVEPGVYKYGVSRNYSGNRESGIVWGKPFGTDNNAKEVLRSINAYSYSRYSSSLPAGWLQYDPTNPLATVKLIDPSLTICSGDFANDGYVHAFTEDNQLLTFDPGIGQIVTVVNTTGHMDDCAFDFSTGVMYGVRGNMLYTIDLSTGALTGVGTVSHDAMGHAIMALACSFDGRLYGFINEWGTLYLIDKNTAHATYVGYGGAWLGDERMTAGFDHSTGTLYWIALDATRDDFIAIVNPETGSFTPLAAGMGMHRAFCVPYGYTPTPTAPESDLVWSNCLDKDMLTTVEVNVKTNTGDSPEGTSVRFINTSEPGQGYDYMVTLDDSGYYSWDEFRKGTYNYTIEKDGYTSCGNHESIEIWEPTSLDCLLEEIALQARNLYVSPTGWAMWKEGLGGDVLHYDSDSYDGGVGASGTPFYWAVKFTPEQLDGFNKVTSVSFYDGPDQSFNGKFMICATSTPLGHILYQKDIVTTGSGQYVEYPLERDVEFNNEESLWIVFYYESGADYPASGSPDTGDPNGRWISTNGLNWDDVSGYGLDYTWKIRCHVKADGREERKLEFYRVFLDGIFVDNTTDTHFQHDVEGFVEGETHTTMVHALYYSGVSEDATYTWTYSPCDNYVGPTDFTAEDLDDMAMLSWNMPENQISGGEWAHYDNGNFVNSIGAGGPTFYWGIMLPAGSWSGRYLGEVAVYDYDAFTGSILIYQGGETAPETLIYTQQYESTGSGRYVEYLMNSLVELDETQNLWVVAHNTTNAGHPAAYAADINEPNSRWISFDALDWHDLTDYDLSGTWMIRAYTTDEMPVVYNILGTMVYRDGELLTETPLPREVQNYADIQAGPGYHDYSIRVVYDDLPIYQGDYYAMSCMETTAVTVGVDENESGRVSVYPNPVNDELTVKAADMKRIRIVNAFGQMVYDRDIAADETRVSMRGFASGVYVVHITTTNGSFANRIVVAHP